MTITLTTTPPPPPQPPPSTQVDGPIQTLFGNLAAGSVDWYVFDYDGTTALSISTTGVVTGTALDTHIAIFNSLGGLIAQNDDIAGVSNRNSQFVANGGLALGALTTDLGALAAGTYYLAVSPFLQSASNGFTVTGGSATAGLGEYSVTFSGVQPIPEPGTYALIGLGLAATTIWGRRRSRV